MMERVDDNDTRISYTPSVPKAWWMAGANSEYNHSTHGSSTAGAQMTFQFRGTRVDVYGTISGNLASLKTINEFTVDDGAPVTWTASPHNPPLYNQRMFSSPTLQEGTHTLTMRITVNNSNTYFDYLEFMPPFSQPSPSSSLSTASFESTTSVQAGGTSSSGDSTSSFTLTSEHSSHSSLGADVVAGTPVGTIISTPSAAITSAGPSISPSSSSHDDQPPPSSIVGISIAIAVMTLVIVGFLIWRYIRRKRRTSGAGSRSNLLHWDSEPEPSDVTATRPYMTAARDEILRSVMAEAGMYECTSREFGPPPPYHR
ncbi:hypothetical protein L218DRAFT_991854 [Marasmius fiardii PR-910]|nr:hypothetical protein L218DRAFT_991854 [Marasmius fiardii PR-910]